MKSLRCTTTYRWSNWWGKSWTVVLNRLSRPIFCIHFWVAKKLYSTTVEVAFYYMGRQIVFYSVLWIASYHLLRTAALEQRKQSCHITFFSCVITLASEPRFTNAVQWSKRKRKQLVATHPYSIVIWQNEIADFLNWTSYYEDAFARVGRPIKASEELVLYASRFMSNMSDLVKEHLTIERGRTTLYNYIVWHAVKPLRMALSKGKKKR